VTALTGSFVYKGTGASKSFTVTGGVDLLIFRSIDVAGSWYVFDSTRGATKHIRLDGGGEVTAAQSVTSFDANGFTIGTDTDINASGGWFEVQWFKKAAGFLDIVSYSSNGSNRTISHALGSIPGMMWVTRAESGFGSAFNVYHQNLNNGTTPENYAVALSSSAGEATDATMWNNTAPTSSVFSLGTNTSVNVSGSKPFMAYIWGTEASSGGQIALGALTTNGSGAATVSGLGFSPKRANFKRVNTSQNWIALNKFRYWGSGVDSNLPINSTTIESFATDYGAPTSDGFTFAGNASVRYLYWVFPDAIDVTDWQFPSTGASETISGGNSADWTNPGNITADDTSEAAMNIGSGTSATMAYLKATDFASIDDTALPVGSTILGFQVMYRRREAGSTDNVSTSRLRMIKGGTIQSSNFANLNTAEWKNTSTESAAENITEGGMDELGGTTWTDTDIKASTFGFTMSPTHSTGVTPDCFVDFMKLRVFHLPVTNVDIFGADASHSHTADGVTFTQNHILVIADATHGHAADAVTFTQAHILVVADATHSHAADNAVVLQNHDLAPNDAEHTHTAESGSFTQSHSVIIADATHSHAADNATFAQVHIFSASDAEHGHNGDNVGLGVDVTVNDATHTHSAESTSFTQSQVMVIGDAEHGHSADNATFAQVHSFSAADASHGHSADTATFSQVHTFPINDAQHGHEAEQAGIAENNATLAPNDATHSHSGDTVTLDQVHIVTSADATHGHEAESGAFSQIHIFGAADATHSHTADAGSFAQTHLFVPAEASHNHTADNTSFTQNHVVASSDAQHAHAADQATIATVHELGPDDAQHGHAAESSAFTQNHSVTVADATHGHTVDSVTLAQIHSLLIEEGLHGHFAEGTYFTQVHVFEVGDAVHNHTADEVEIINLSSLTAASDRTFVSQGAGREVISSLISRSVSPNGGGRST